MPEFLVFGLTLGVLLLLAYWYGKGDRARLRSSIRVTAMAVGGVTLLAATIGIVFRDQVISAFSGEDSVLAIGVVVLTAQLVAMTANGFAGLITSLFQATGRAVPAIVLSMAQGILFIPIVIVANLWFDLSGIIWALTVTEILVLVVGLVMWFASRRAIDRGLAEGSPERADEVLEQVEG